MVVNLGSGNQIFVMNEFGAAGPFAIRRIESQFYKIPDNRHNICCRTRQFCRSTGFLRSGTPYD